MLCWGAAYVPSAWLVETWPPLTAAGARLGLGRGGPAGRPVRRSASPCARGSGSATVGWLALTQTVLFYGATFWGIVHAGRRPAAVLANTDPLFVAALASVAARRVAWRGASGWGCASGWWARRWWSGRGRSGRRSSRATPWWWSRGAFAWSVGTVVAARGMRGGADAAGPGRLADGGRGDRARCVVGLVGEEGLPPLGAREVGLVARPRDRRSAASARALLPGPRARARAAEVSAWFFLIPVVGVLSAWPLLGEQPDAAAGGRPGGGVGRAVAGARRRGLRRRSGW